MQPMQPQPYLVAPNGLLAPGTVLVPWLPVITGYFYGIKKTFYFYGVFLVLITNK